MNVLPLGCIRCEGSPFQMGLSYGQQARDAIQYNLAYMRSRWQPVPQADWAASLQQVLTEHLPDVLEELRGIAKGANVSLEELLRYNHWLGHQGCTTVAVIDSPDGPLVGKNNDGNEDLKFVVRHSQPERGLPMIQVTYAGWLSGLDSMNAAGLSCMHASVGSVFDKQGPYVDIRLAAYHLLRYTDRTGSLVDHLKKYPLTGKGYNIIVQDAAGATQVIEAAVPLIATRPIGDANFVYTTNHYQTEALASSDRRPAGRKTVSQYRYGYLAWREACSPPGDLAGLRELLSSHEPWAPCRHGGAHLSVTLWSMIAQPAHRRVLVCHGPPCANTYEVHALEPTRLAGHKTGDVL